MWTAELADSSKQQEWNPDGSETPFAAIHKKLLTRFHLVSANGEDDYFDARTGYFHVSGRCYVFPLAGFLELGYGLNLIQFKNAHTEFIATQNGRMLPKYTGFVIDQYAFGWKVQKDGILSKSILYVNARDGSKFFETELTFQDIRRKFGYTIGVK